MRAANRRLLWLTVGFALGCFAGISWFWDSLKVLQMLGLGMLPVCAALLIPAKPWLRIPGWILAGLCASVFFLNWYQARIIAPITELDGQTLPLTVTATDYSRPGMYSMSVDGTVEYKGHRYQTIVYLTEDRNVNPGDKLSGNFRLRLTSPGGLKDSSYYQGLECFLLASQKGELFQTPAEGKTLSNLAKDTAKRLTDTISSCFPEDTAAFAKALLLGDTDDLDYVTDTALKLSGIRHIVAVSGLHISILYLVLFHVFGTRKILLPALTVTVLTFFAAVTGFTPSVVRACIMAILSVLAFSFNLELDSPTALAAACLAMLLDNPFIILSVSFQLSTASVAGILLFYSPLYGWFRNRLPKKLVKSKLANGILASISVSVSAMSFSTLLSVYYFHTVSLVSLLTNVLVVWCVSFIFCGIALVCILGFFWLPAAKLTASAVSILIRFVLFTAKLLASFPLAAVYTTSGWITAWVVLCYILLVLFLLLRRKHALSFCIINLAALLAAIALSWTLPQFDNCRLTVMYVGEGQCILLQSMGHSLLVDCGGNSDVNTANTAAEQLLGQGIFRLDGIVLTHYDRDHTGALSNLLTRVKADKLYLPVMDDKGVLSVLEEKTNAERIYVESNQTFTLGNAEVTLYETGTLKTENENCVCLLFDTTNCDILITGDRGKSGEKRLIKQNQLPDVDILIAGHHGSKNSTSEALLEAVTPETVIVSAGINNSYHHPAPELLERLEQYGCTVRRTDLDGTIFIRR